MLFIPAEAPDKLELNKIISLLQELCLSDVAREQIANAPFLQNIQLISTALSEIAEMKDILIEDGSMPLSDYAAIDKDIALLNKIGFVLDLESIIKIEKVLSNYFSFDDFFGKDKRKTYDNLYALLQAHEIDPKLRNVISKIIDEDGEVRRNASPNLASIYKEIDQKSRETNKVFNRIVGEFKNKGLLSDIDESYRHGRRVLAVPAEHKRKINGIIHDESGTGKTVFIEPQSVVLLNNEILDLESDKRKEIYKILKDLCDQLRPSANDLLSAFEFVKAIDVLLAKARFAIKLNAVKPVLVQAPTLELKTAYHPLLYLKQKNTADKTIPFDLELYGKNRIILISGPNAGGKSITMKAVGLLQLMVQKAMLIPVAENSKIGIFKKVFTDIGDQQSIEDDLSTYSSRLLNMKNFLKSADEETLVLIDEFGSGTDPKIGGAIAEGILNALVRNKIYGVITTHYSNLKIYAYKTKGLVNGAMHFDDKELKPTYQLMIGKPGSSFAFEIAEKIGLQHYVIKYAKHKTGKNERAIDNLLINLQREKKSIEGKLSSLENKEANLEKLIKNYTELQRELEYKRKKYKLEQKEFDLQKSNEVQKEIDKVVKEIKSKNNNVQSIQSSVKKHQAKRKKVAQEVKDIKQELFYKEDFKIKDFKKGDFVKLRSGGMSGQIIRISKKVAEVQTGNMTVNIPLVDLAPSKEPLDINPRRRITTDVSSSSSSFDSKVDIRGYRHNEAVAFIEEFMDKALVANASRLEILHGKGNGILKKVVHKKLREYNDVKEISHPAEDAGGEGITLVSL